MHISQRLLNMAAYAALVSVMQIIHQIEDHPFPPISIHTHQLQSLTQIITSLQKFLEGYNSPVADSDEDDPLEMRIADAAYAAEDVIESYIVHKIKLARSTTAHDDDDDDDQEAGSGEESSTSSSGEENAESSTISSSGEEPSFYEDLHQVIEDMNMIKKEVEFRNDQLPAASAASTTSSSSSTMQNSNMVGFDDVSREVFFKLTDGGRGRQVIPVVGMGGIGKTTLVRNIYAKKVIKKNFHICAWVTVSKKCDSKEILCEILSQASGESKEQLSKMSEEKLKLQLHQYLFGRRYLIVLDDIWSVDEWDSTRLYFPENNKGSRVVVTTRLSSLGSELDNSNSVQMKFLDEGFSWELFTKTVFGERGCPPELEEIGKKIAENCRGLPLSIVVVGGFLKNMEHTQKIWRSVWDNLTSIVILENDKHCLKLLKTSYNHLPVHLKPCFLYLGLFEEDDEISVKTLIRLWVSEGFLSPRNGQSLETIALGFIKELDDRNLIIVDEWGCTGNIKGFKMHDLLMDLCSREGQTQRFYHVIRHKRRHRRRRCRHPHRCRRLLIDDTTSNEEAHEALQSMPLVRSIICEENDKVLACQNLRLLRILNEYTSHEDESDGSPLVFQFVNLRHAIVEVQSKLSIHHLWNLQTLIVYAYERLEVPTEIWRMRQLRHIEFIEAKLHLPDPPVDDVVVVMENLHTLKGVENLKLGEEVIKRIPNIKRLLIENDDDDDYCVSNIECLHKLESLTYQEKWGRVNLDLNKLKFPHSIKKLTLTTSYDDETMGKIGSLPHLQKLKLMCGSFRRGKWEIGKDQFESLKSLTLFWCDGLKQWTVADGVRGLFPCLERLRLSRLTQLNEIPPEIGDVAMLQSIELTFCSESAVASAREILDDHLQFQDEEDLEFHVLVLVDKKHRIQELKSLASPNFEVEVTQHS